MDSTFAVKVCPSDWRIENLVQRLSLQLSGLFYRDLHAHVVYSPPLLTSPRSRVKVKAGLLETVPVSIHQSHWLQSSSKAAIFPF